MWAPWQDGRTTLIFLPAHIQCHSQDQSFKPRFEGETQGEGSQGAPRLWVWHVLLLLGPERFWAFVSIAGFPGKWLFPNEYPSSFAIQLLSATTWACFLHFTRLEGPTSLPPSSLKADPGSYLSLIPQHCITISKDSMVDYWKGNELRREPADSLRENFWVTILKLWTWVKPSLKTEIRNLCGKILNKWQWGASEGQGARHRDGGHTLIPKTKGWEERTQSRKLSSLYQWLLYKINRCFK